jgi:hypothetical protein
LNNSIRWKWIHNIDKKIEKKTIDKMDAIITVGPSLVQILNRKTTKKIHLISNGFDDTYFSELTYEANTKFRITYAGSLSKEQDPQCFFDTLEILKLNKEFFDNTELEFLGNFPIYLHDIVDASPYKNHTHFSPYTFYTDSLKSIAASELLLLIIPKTDDNKCIITSKLFDYMGAQRPVLAFGPVDGDAASILRETGAGQIFDYSDIKNASEFILSEFNNWKNKTNSYQADKNKIKQFTRKNLTKKLAEIFDSLVKK